MFIHIKNEKINVLINLKSITDIEITDSEIIFYFMASEQNPERCLEKGKHLDEGEFEILKEFLEKDAYRVI